MTAPDPRALLALDAPLPAVPAELGPRLRSVALARRRRRRLTSATAGVALVAATAAATVPWGGSGTETLTPAPRATQPSVAPSEGLAEGEALPELDVPPCVDPGGYQRTQGVPGQQRGPERLQSSVQENMTTGFGFLPEVEQALVDTAPPSARIDCASSGTVVFLTATEGSYVEIHTALVNPLHAGSLPEYFSRDDVETYATPGGARVRLEESGRNELFFEIWAGRYDVSLSSRVTDPGAAGMPPADARGWVDRLGDRLVEESARRGEVPVDLLDRTPNPPPQEVVDRVLATAPDGARLLGPQAGPPSQAERIAVLHPDGRAAALVLVASTTNPRQSTPLTAESLRELGAEIEDERDGWPPGLLVGVVDRHNQILLQHEDRVFLNFTGDDRTVVGPERLRRWALDVARELEQAPDATPR